jgi:hypothetical protein
MNECASNYYKDFNRVANKIFAGVTIHKKRSLILRLISSEFFFITHYTDE